MSNTGNISIAAVIDKNKIASDRAWLIALKIHVRNPITGVIDEIIRLVNNTEDVTIDGELYGQFGFEIDITKALSETPRVTISLYDMSGLVLQKAEAYDGGVGFQVELIVAQPPNGTTYVTEADLVEFFDVVDASANGFILSWTLGAEDFLTIPFPRRKQFKDRCSFRYKSPECGYVGALPTCDLTLSGPNGCRAHNNGINFGGCPGILKRL